MESIKYLPSSIPEEIVDFFSFPYTKEKFPQGQEVLKHLLLYKTAVEQHDHEIIVAERFMKPLDNFDQRFETAYEDLSVDIVLLSHYIRDWSVLKVDEESESTEVLRSTVDYVELNPWAYLISYDQMERMLEKYMKPFRLWDKVSLSILFPEDRTRLYQRSLFYRDEEGYSSYYDYYK